METKQLNPIEQLTLECLMNPVHYDRYIQQRTVTSSLVQQEDISKYTPEVIQLTMQMCQEQYPNYGLKQCFYEYINACIIHIKSQKIHDNIQQDYAGLETIPEEIDDTIDPNSLLINKQNPNATLDTFVVKKKKKRKKPKYPKKRLEV